MGVHPRPGGPLGSIDHDFPYAGLPVLRAPAMGTSFNQCITASDDCDIAIPGAPADDGGALAQRLRGGGVCHSSAAGGIRGMGVGTQGCLERAVLHADDCSLRALHPQAAVASPLSDDVIAICAGIAVQGHAGDTTVCTVASGLLAAGPFPGFPAPDSRKSAFFCTLRGGGCGPDSCDQQSHFHRKAVSPYTNLQRPGVLRRIHGRNDLSLGSGRLASLSRQQSAGLGSGSGAGGAVVHLHRRHYLAAQISFLVDRLAVVPGHAGATNGWADPGRASANRPLHLPAANRPVYRHRMDVRQSVFPTSSSAPPAGNCNDCGDYSPGSRSVHSNFLLEEW